MEEQRSAQLWELYIALNFYIERPPLRWAMFSTKRGTKQTHS